MTHNVIVSPDVASESESVLQAEDVPTDECRENKFSKINIEDSKRTVDAKFSRNPSQEATKSNNSTDPKFRSQVSTNQSTPESPKVSDDPELILMHQIHRNLLIQVRE